MCGRFFFEIYADRVRPQFKIRHKLEPWASYNIAPSQDVPVVRNIDGERRMDFLRWGLVPSWAKDTKIAPINARAETVSSKPYFRSAFKQRRCLIPANGYYEWQKLDGKKAPYLIAPPTDSPIIAFAGLWEIRDYDGEQMETCTIITTQANEQTRKIHDRMPVILPDEAYEEWLEVGGQALLRPYEGPLLMHEVSRRVNNPQNNDLFLLQPHHRPH